jgi:fumarylacetoacetate (FAA) hydrolase family protein
MTAIIALLPDDAEEATLVGRIIGSDGPIPVALANGRLRDLSASALTVADLLIRLDPGEALPPGRDLGPLSDHDFAPAWEGGAGALLAPIDLQCIKAAGVTFAASILERVIEERAGGSAERAAELRDRITARIGADLRTVKPGSSEAAELKLALVQDGLWSQYLEVAIGPNAEVFTKSPVLSAVGSGALVGIRSDSQWNNPEPELVLVVDPRGRVRGATLGNDVNLRDIEGRSALLLGKAKDNNASCALGPFIRLFDEGYTIDDVRSADITLSVDGEDGFRLQGTSSMRLISRDPLELVSQTYGKHHRYPDGFVLFTGTLFAPIEDRDQVGQGFTHKVGDIVTISSPRLGTLTNRVVHCEDAPPWEFGISELVRSLGSRRVLMR